MTTPQPADKCIKLRAYMTDEHFGYDYWAACQFAMPTHAQHVKPALLLTFETERDRDAAFDLLKDLP